MKAHYQPVDDGYQIIGSSEIFNRVLYGGHDQDDAPERFFTFAGDQPLIMGAINDRTSAYHLAKCGVFMAGLALTPGLRQPLHMTSGGSDGDNTSKWLHESEGTVSTYRNGWMEYEIAPFFQCFPAVKIFMQVLPLLSQPGFLVHLRIWVDQRAHLVLGFGGVTDFLAPFGAREVGKRNFTPADCLGNAITLGPNRALIENQIRENDNTPVRKYG